MIKYKVGDTVVCKMVTRRPTNHPAMDGDYPGVGYEPGKEFTIQEISSIRPEDVLLWNEEQLKGGVWAKAVTFTFDRTAEVFDQLKKEVTDEI